LRGPTWALGVAGTACLLLLAPLAGASNSSPYADAAADGPAAAPDLTAVEVAELANLSRVTARRYVDHLVQLGRVEVVMRYGSPGRPEHLYHLVARPATVASPDRSTG